MSDQPTTWDEFRQMLAQAYESIDVEYDRIADNLMHGTSRKDALHGMSTALAETRENLDKLVNLAIRLTPPKPPVRPLEAVLADIREMGHQTIRLSWHHDSWYLDTDTGAVKFDHARQADQAYVDEYRQTIESALSWGEDPVVLAEARLAQLRELHAEKQNPTEDEIEAFLTAIGAGPEEDERAAHVVPTEFRWNVWSKDTDGEWAVTNSNLNEKQAKASLKRMLHAALVQGPAGAMHTMLPVGQVPDQPPVDVATALVFLNPDAEAQPVAGGPTDEAELDAWMDEHAVAREDHQRESQASEDAS